MSKGQINSPGRGETAWGCNVVRVLDNLGHKLYVYSFSNNRASFLLDGIKEEPEPLSDRAVLIPHEGFPKYEDIVKNKFDIAIFLTNGKADTLRNELREDNENKIKADIYIYGVIWEGDCHGRELFKDNDILVRQFQFHLDHNPNEGDHFLLARPLGKTMGESKFNKKRIGWTPKSAFHKQYNAVRTPNIASKFLNAMVDAALETNTGITIFSSDKITNEPEALDNVKGFKVLETLSRVKDIRFLPTCSPNEFYEELKNCSIVFPIGAGVSGSVLEAIFFGITPIVFRDSLLMGYPKIIDVAAEMTEGKLTKECSQDYIKKKMVQLLTDENYYNYFLNKLQPFFRDNLDSEVAKQFEVIINYAKKKGLL